MTESEIILLIEAKIKKDEKIDEVHSGGSGHLSSKDFVLLEYKKLEEKKYSYEYEIILTTEFTVEPDHPPYRNIKSGTIDFR